jgi:hypothetical protein
MRDDRRRPSKRQARSRRRPSLPSRCGDGRAGRKELVKRLPLRLNSVRLHGGRAVLIGSRSINIGMWLAWLVKDQFWAARRGPRAGAHEARVEVTGRKPATAGVRSVTAEQGWRIKRATWGDMRITTYEIERKDDSFSPHHQALGWGSGGYDSGGSHAWLPR